MNYKEKQNFYKYLSKMTLTVWDSSVKGSYEKKRLIILRKNYLNKV